MDIADLQNELQRLPADQQNRLAAFLTALRMKREGLMSEIQECASDGSTENWIPWKDAKKELGFNVTDSE